MIVLTDQERRGPSLTTDIALFRVGGSGWEILLVRRGHEPFLDHWSLPGGFVDYGEPIERAAARELEEETGIRGVELWQLRAFGSPDRDPRGHTVSIAYLGIAAESTEAFGGDDAAEARWWDVLQVPRLAFDHDEVLRVALERLRQIESRRAT